MAATQTTQNISLPTQCINTQSAAQPGDFTDWCERFLFEYDRHKDALRKDPDCDGRPRKFKEGAMKFFQASLNENGKRYTAIFRHLAMRCSVDSGTLACRSTKAFIDLGEVFKLDPVHFLYILRNMSTLLESSRLSVEVASTLMSTFQQYLFKQKPAWIEHIHSTLREAIIHGRLTNQRCVDMAAFISTRPPMQESWPLRKFLLHLLKECNDKAISAVVGTTDGFDESVFVDFVEYVLSSFDLPTDLQMKNFIKVMAVLPHVPDYLVKRILSAYVNEWANKDSDFFEEVEAGIAQFHAVTKSHPSIAHTTYNFFQKNGKCLRLSSFGILIALISMQDARYGESLKQLLSKALTKLWDINNVLKTDAWSRSAIPDVKLNDVVDKLTTILMLANSTANLGEVLNPAIVTLGIRLIDAGDKTCPTKVVDGRLEGSTTSVSFIGRWLLTKTISCCHEKEINGYLKMIVRHLCSTNSCNVAYSLIDVLVELRSKILASMVMNWEAFEDLTSNITQLNPKVAVKVMSALMPVINQRSGLRSQIFKSLKTDILNAEKAAIAIPVMLHLLRSLVDQPEIKNAIQTSQSFATFSSQVGDLTGKRKGGSDAIEIMECIKQCLRRSADVKVHVYKGSVEICKKNAFFVIQALDLLSNELATAPKLAAKSYFCPNNNVVVLSMPLPHLIKAVSTVLTIVAAKCEDQNLPRHTQLNMNGVDFAFKVENRLNAIINHVISTHLDDMELDTVNDHLSQATTIGEQYRSFAMLVLQTYDVVVEHLWNSVENGTDPEAIDKIFTILNRRSELQKLVDVNTKKAVAYPFSMTNDLHIEVPRLTAMLRGVQAPDASYTVFGDETKTPVLLSWLIGRIRDTVKCLNNEAVTGLASLDALTLMARALFGFFLNDNVTTTMETDSAALRKAKTHALEAFEHIITYLVKRYGQHSLDALIRILLVVNVNPTEQFTQTYGTVDDPNEPFVIPLSAEAASDQIDAAKFETITGIYVATLCSDVIPGIISMHQSYEAERALAEYSAQICTLLKLCQVLIEESITTDKGRFDAFKSLAFSLGYKYFFNDRKCDEAYAKCLATMIIHSDCDKRWTNRLTVLVNATADLLQPPDDRSAAEPTYACITAENVETYYCMVVNVTGQIFAKFHRVMKIRLDLDGSITDDFFPVIVEKIKEHAAVFDSLVVLDEEAWHSDRIMTVVIEAVTEFYTMLHVLFQELENKANKGTDIMEWPIANVLRDLVCNELDRVVSFSVKRLGNDDFKPLKKDKATAKDVARIVMRDDKFLGNMNKELTKLFNRILLLQDKTSFCEDVPLLHSAKTKKIRDFRIETAVVKDCLNGGGA